jgi:hypothetical protein
MGVGLVLLILGQVMLLNGENLAIAVILMVLCLVLFVLALTGKYMIFSQFVLETFNSLVEMKIKKPEETKELILKNVSENSTIPPVKFSPGIFVSRISDFFRDIIKSKQGFLVNFFIPKWILFVVVAILFGITQLFFFRQELKPAVFLLVIDIILLIVGLFRKNGFTVELGLENGLKILYFITGAVLVVIGWVMLINLNVKIQEIGVAFTIPGSILLFFALPKTNNDYLPDTGRKDILFLKPDFLNSYIAKGIMLIIAFISLKIGIKVMQNPDYDMFSMVFYALSGILIFFTFPLFNFPDKQYDNKMVDIIRLGVVIAAFAIAYAGQTFFVKHDINNAVNYYFIAAILFIFAFPVYGDKEAIDREPFPIYLEVIILLIIVAVGIFLRTHEINVRPFGIENDEAGGAANRFDLYGNPLIAPSVGNFGLPIHIVQLFISIIGQLNRLSLRMMGVSVGILSLPMLYFLIRAVVGPRAAIFTAAIYTVLRWNVYYGRYGCTFIYSNAMEIAMLYFTIKAFNTRNKFIWFILGLCVGLAWHGVLTAFLLIFPILIYFSIKTLSEKGYFKRYIVPLLAFFLGFWIFGSMIVHNYFISTNIYFSRTHEVSVFSNDPNAPSKNVAKGIVQNAKDVLLMFNNAGDSRQRNSGGMPFEPTVDFLTSVFFALGFLYCLYYSKYYIFFIMLLVFFSQAAGSIFSIEAPSAMRALGTMFPMLFFIAVIFDKLWLAFRKVLGKKLEVIYLPVLLLVFLVPITKENYNQYFNRWIGGLDELATAGGMYAEELGKKTWVMLYTGLYYPGHPPFKFFRWEYKTNSGAILTRDLIYLKEITNEDFAIFFHYDTWNNIDSVKSTLFPDSNITVVDQHTFNNKVAPGGGLGTFIKVLDITNAQIQNIRGLTGNYSFGGQVRKNEDVSFSKDDDSKIPYGVTWKGMILIPYYGKFRFFNRGTSHFSLDIDGKAMSPENYAVLAEGFHKISVTVVRHTARETLNLSMECKKFVDGETIGGVENIAINKSYLYNFRSVGLHGYYYKGKEWDSNPLDQEIININMCLSGGDISNSSEIWKGNIIIPSTDIYRITAATNGYARIVLDGKYYWEQPNGGDAFANDVENYFKNRKLIREGNFKLSAGRHSIEIYSSNASLIELQWAKGISQNFVPVPIDALEPDCQITKD